MMKKLAMKKLCLQKMLKIYHQVIQAMTMMELKVIVQVQFAKMELNQMQLVGAHAHIMEV